MACATFDCGCFKVAAIVKLAIIRNWFGLVVVRPSWRGKIGGAIVADCFNCPEPITDFNCPEPITDFACPEPITDFNCPEPITDFNCPEPITDFVCPEPCA